MRHVFVPSIREAEKLFTVMLWPAQIPPRHADPSSRTVKLIPDAAQLWPGDRTSPAEQGAIVGVGGGSGGSGCEISVIDSLQAAMPINNAVE